MLHMGNLELWYSTIKEKDILDSLDASARAGAEKMMAKPVRARICRYWVN